jgi:hypothetical protein
MHKYLHTRHTHLHYIHNTYMQTYISHMHAYKQNQYIYIYIYAHTYVRGPIYIHPPHTHTHTYIYIYIYIYTYLHTQKHTYLHTYTHIYIHTHTHIHTHTDVPARNPQRAPRVVFFSPTLKCTGWFKVLESVRHKIVLTPLLKPRSICTDDRMQTGLEAWEHKLNKHISCSHKCFSLRITFKSYISFPRNKFNCV